MLIVPPPPVDHNSYIYCVPPTKRHRLSLYSRQIHVDRTQNEEDLNRIEYSIERPVQSQDLCRNNNNNNDLSKSKEEEDDDVEDDYNFVNG